MTNGKLTTRLLAVAAVAFLAGMLASTVLSNLAAIVIGVLAGAAGGLVALRLQTKARAAPAPAAPKAPDVEEMLRGLLHLNVEARTRGFAAEMLERTERAIDLLRELLPVVNGELSSNGLTWEVNRAATEYLPHLVGTYAGAAGSADAELVGEAAASMAALIGALERAQHAVHTQREDELGVAAKFMSARFGAAGA